MMAMPVAAVAPETSADHVRTEGANHAHHIAKGDVMAVPHLKGFIRRFGESEIGNPGETLVNSVIAVGRQQLQGANDAEFIQKIAANFVLAAFATIQGELQGGDAVSARFKREHAAVFVVRMGDGMHEARRGMQAAQHLFQPGVAGIHRKRLGIDPRRWNLREGCRRQKRENQVQTDART